MSVSIISIFTNWCQVLALQQRLQFKKVLNGFPNGRSIGGVKFAVIVRCEWNFLQPLRPWQQTEWKVRVQARQWGTSRHPVKVEDEAATFEFMHSTTGYKKIVLCAIAAAAGAIVRRGSGSQVEGFIRGVAWGRLATLELLLQRLGLGPARGVCLITHFVY